MTTTDEQKIKFLAMVIEEGKKINISISHEDGQGEFQIGNYDESDAKWLLAANLNPE